MVPRREHILPAGTYARHEDSPMADRSRWIVTVAGDRPVDDVRMDLVTAGFDVDQVLTEIGCIIGEASPKAAERARKLRGVADVSPDEVVDIGPPDDAGTW